MLGGKSMIFQALESLLEMMQAKEMQKRERSDTVSTPFWQPWPKKGSDISYTRVDNFLRLVYRRKCEISCCFLNFNCVRGSTATFARPHLRLLQCLPPESTSIVLFSIWPLPWCLWSMDVMLYCKILMAILLQVGSGGSCRAFRKMSQFQVSGNTARSRGIRF